IDADEFIVAAHDGDLFSDFLESFADKPEIGAVVLNWANYGSNGEMQYRNAPVTQRFIKRAAKGHPVNNHYKSVIRPQAYDWTTGTPHHFRMKPAYRQVQANGAGLFCHETRGEGISAAVTWEPFRINHYIVKSHQEFFEKKRLRGRATVVGEKRD